MEEYDPLDAKDDNFLPPLPSTYDQPPPPPKLPPPPPTPKEAVAPPPPPLPPSAPTTTSMLLPALSLASSSISHVPALNDVEVRERNIAIENLKRKASSKTSNSMKTKKLKGFELDDDDDGDDNPPQARKTNNQAKCNNVSSTSSNVTESTVEQSNEISHETLILITKTATWISDNPDKAAMLLEKSRGSEKMSFLFDRHSPAGIKYQEELSRYKAEKEVSSIFQATDVTAHRDAAGLSGAYTNYGLAGSVAKELRVSSEPVVADALSRARSAATAIAATMLGQQTTSHQLVSPTFMIHDGTKTAALSASTASEIAVTVTAPAIASKRVKKSRWGEAPNGTAVASESATGISTSPATLNSSIPALEPEPPLLSAEELAAATAAAKATVAAAVAEKRKWDAQIREQKEMQLLECRIRQAISTSNSSIVGSSSAELSKEEILYQERLREYADLASRFDEDFKDTYEEAEANNGVIAGGTFEHRKRAKEMLATAEKNLQLTALAAGRHHIADFLPKSELDKFLKKAEALKSGNILTTNDFEEHKLTSSNVGFQMLQKAGWTEGNALGSASISTSSSVSTNISLTAPLNMNGQLSSETRGLGTQSVHELEATDSEFDQYRKRMMLAYRFRPNPLNNPRRDYY